MLLFNFCYIHLLTSSYIRLTGLHPSTSFYKFSNTDTRSIFLNHRSDLVSHLPNTSSFTPLPTQSQYKARVGVLGSPENQINLPFLSISTTLHYTRARPYKFSSPAGPTLSHLYAFVNGGLLCLGGPSFLSLSHSAQTHHIPILSLSELIAPSIIFPSHLVEIILKSIYHLSSFMSRGILIIISTIMLPKEIL